MVIAPPPGSMLQLAGGIIHEVTASIYFANLSRRRENQKAVSKIYRTLVSANTIVHE
jgi:hypothetical protein